MPKCPTHLAHRFLDPHEFAPPPKWYLDWFSHFCSAQCSQLWQQTQRQTMWLHMQPCQASLHPKSLQLLTTRRFALMPNAPFRLNTENFNCYWLMRAKIQHPPNWPLHICIVLPSGFWRCWLGGRKSIRPVKKLSGGVQAWLSVWSEVQTRIWPSWCHCHSLSLASVKSRLVYLSGSGSPV